MPRHILSSDRIFSGLIFDVDRDRLQEDDGREVTREVVRHPGGSGGLPVFSDGTVALVSQYRHPAGRELLEIPAGRIEAGETPEDCARREIEDETASRPERLEKLAEFYSTPGFCEEKLYVYLATQLRPSSQSLDHDERLNVVRMPFREALALVHSGQIQDSKTIVALLLAEPRLKSLV